MNFIAVDDAERKFEERLASQCEPILNLFAEEIERSWRPAAGSPLSYSEIPARIQLEEPVTEQMLRYLFNACKEYGFRLSFGQCRQRFEIRKW